jgi:VanZ family protein
VNKPVSLWLRILAWLAFVAWTGTIYYFSSLTGPEIAQFGIQIWDKVEHFAAFAAGGVSLALALRWSVTWPWKSVALFAILILVVYGALDETHQLFTPNRSGADPFDWLADCFGALTGVFLFVLIYVRFFPAHQPAPTRAGGA